MLLLWWILIISIVYHSGSISKTTISLLFNSIRRSLAGPDQIHAGKRNGPEEISIHRSLAGPDCREVPQRAWLWYFNPQVPCGTRRIGGLIETEKQKFQSTGPLRDPTFPVPVWLCPLIFQSTGPLRDPTADTLLCRASNRYFNPQVPCGTRLCRVGCVYGWLNFNPQVPCGTRRLRSSAAPASVHFNPQVPCGTRLQSSLVRLIDSDFNPQVPCGTRRWLRTLDAQVMRISIHRSLAGPDPRPDSFSHSPVVFQSTGPLRDPTLRIRRQRLPLRFQSTGPLRDPTLFLDSAVPLFFHFNPQVPCGTRLFHF